MFLNDDEKKKNDLHKFKVILIFLSFFFFFLQFVRMVFGGSLGKSSPTLFSIILIFALFKKEKKNFQPLSLSLKVTLNGRR